MNGVSLTQQDAEEEVVREDLPGIQEHAAFFERVVRVCRLRDEARGRKVEFLSHPAPPPFFRYAEVSFVEERQTRVYALAAVASPVTRELVELFCLRIHKCYAETDPATLSALVYGGGPPPEDVARWARRQRISLLSFSEL